MSSRSPAWTVAGAGARTVSAGVAAVLNAAADKVPGVTAVTDGGGHEAVQVRVAAVRVVPADGAGAGTDTAAARAATGAVLPAVTDDGAGTEVVLARTVAVTAALLPEVTVWTGNAATPVTAAGVTAALTGTALYTATAAVHGTLSPIVHAGDCDPVPMKSAAAHASYADPLTSVNCWVPDAQFAVMVSAASGLASENTAKYRP